jgi:two-component system, NarL family, response regulator LiaR
MNSLPEPVPPPDTRLRVILADDDPLARRVVRDVLQESGVVVIAEASGGREAVELSLHYKPDVVLLDIVMPDLDGLTAMRRILAQEPTICIVLLTATDDDKIALLGLRMGASGFLAKDIDVDVLPKALMGAHNGEAVVSRRTTMRLVENLRRVRDDGAGLRPVRSTLTAREWEILDLLCQGSSTEDIAFALVVSVETVRSHVKNLLRKLGVHSRHEAVARAEQMRAELLVQRQAAHGL